MMINDKEKNILKYDFMYLRKDVNLVLNNYKSRGKRFNDLVINIKDFCSKYDRLVQLEKILNDNFNSYLGEMFNDNSYAETVIYLLDNCDISKMIYWEIENWELNITLKDKTVINIPLYSGNEDFGK